MAIRFLSADPKVIRDLTCGFVGCFGCEPAAFYSAPGRTEIGGNHTDHQRGRVLAAAVDLDTRAAVRVNGDDQIRVRSEGYPLYTVDLDRLDPVPEERNTTAALIRGIAARFREMGYPVGGFDAYVQSSVLPGSGLSSSAAFEVLMGTVINDLFCRGGISPVEVAQVGQYAENVYFGKPCGLMDQMASALGGLVAMDFSKDEIHAVNFDFSACGHALCIIDSGGDHADLTAEYAAIPGEMGQVCACFGREVLTQISEEEFYAAIPELRKCCGDRAVLRCIHFYGENARVPMEVAALEKGEFGRFLDLVRQSGESSWMYLQNVIPAGETHRQELALVLALCRRYLGETGAYRVHGGGFGGTVQAFVPLDRLEAFKTGMEAVLGAGACHVLNIRNVGGARLICG